MCIYRALLAVGGTRMTVLDPIPDENVGLDLLRLHT
jgi:hypothetical protein